MCTTRTLVSIAVCPMAMVLLACSGTVDDPVASETTGLPSSAPIPVEPGAGGSISDERSAVRWATTLSGPSSEDEVDGVAAGVDGSLFVTGKFERSTVIGGVELSSAGRADIPLARFDRDGRAVWVQRFGGEGEDNFFDIDANDDGAVATGIFEGTVRFGDVSLTSSGGTDCVVVAFSNDGAVRWARAFGGPGNDGCNEVVVDADGSVVTSIDTEGGWDSPAGPILPLRWRDTLLLRLGADGRPQWAQRVGGEGPQRGKAIDLDPNG